MHGRSKITRAVALGFLGPAAGSPPNARKVLDEKHVKGLDGNEVELDQAVPTQRTTGRS
jgi:hypothetical protein